MSSRTVSAMLKFASAGQRQAGGGRCFSVIFLTETGVYTPMFRVTRGIKEVFWNDLQVCLAAVPGSDRLLMLADFNARLGYCKSDDDVCSMVLGHHGVDVRNQAGEDFLTFCEIIQLSIMN